jgi:hypothetical protein
MLTPSLKIRILNKINKNICVALQVLYRKIKMMYLFQG